MSQKEHSVSLHQLHLTKRDLDVELGLELNDSGPDDNPDENSDEGPRSSWHKNPLHVRRIKRKDGRPVSAEVNYDLTSRKLLIYTFSSGADDDGDSSTNTVRRVPASDQYLRRQSTPDAFRGVSDIVGAHRAIEHPSDPVVMEPPLEQGVVWEKRRSYEGCGASEDDVSGAVYPILTWGDLRNQGDAMAGEKCSSSSSTQWHAGNPRVADRTLFFRGEDKGRGTHADKQTPVIRHRPLSGRFPCVEGSGNFQGILNREEIGEGRWNGNLQTSPRTGSSLPSVVSTNDVQFRSQEDMRRIWPAQIEWRVPDGDQEPSTRGILAHKIREIGMKSADHSDAGQTERYTSLPHDANIHSMFWKQNAKFQTATGGTCHSEEFEASLEGIRGEGALRQWRHFPCVDSKLSIDKGVPLRIEIPDDNLTRQSAKDRCQRTEAGVLRSSSTYLNFRRPEVIREGLALQSNFNGTGNSRNLTVYSSNRFGETSRTLESGNAETMSTGDSNGSASQVSDSLTVVHRKPLEIKESCQGRFGSLRDVDVTGSLHRIAISLEERLDDVSEHIGNSGSPTPPQTNQVRLEKTVASTPHNNESSNSNEDNTTSQVQCSITGNLSESETPTKLSTLKNNHNIIVPSDTGEDRKHSETALLDQRSSQDGFESNSSILLQQIKDRRFLSESKIQDIPQANAWHGEFPRTSRPLQDRSCSFPIIIHNTSKTPENVLPHDSLDTQHQPLQSGSSISSCYQPSRETCTGEASMIPGASQSPAACNTFDSNQPILDSSTFSKDLNSPDSGRSFAQSDEYIFAKPKLSPMVMGIVPTGSLSEVPADNRGSNPTQNEKTKRNSLPLVFYNSKYKQAETIDPIARETNGKERDTWMQSSGTGDSSWQSLTGIHRHIEAERADGHESVKHRQDVPLCDSILTQRKPPKPKPGISVQSQPGDWRYNTIYDEPDTPSPLNEISTITNESTQQDDHDAAAMANQPKDQWNSLPSLLDCDNKSDPTTGTCKKTVSSDRVYTGIWTPSRRPRPFIQTSMPRSPVDKHLPETKSGSSAWVYLKEDAANRCNSGKEKTTYNREIRQIPSVAGNTFLNTRRQSDVQGQKPQRDSAAQSPKAKATKANTTSMEPINLAQGVNCSDLSLCDVVKTQMEQREWKSSEVLLQKEHSQQDRPLNINHRTLSTPGTFEDEKSKPCLVHIPVQHEGTVNPVRLKVPKQLQSETFPTEQVHSSLPAVSSSPVKDEPTGDVMKLVPIERVTSDLPSNTTVQQAICLKPNMTPNRDSSPSNHPPQIDITTIKARVFRITEDNGATEFITSSNQQEKTEGLRNKLFTQTDVVDEQPLTRDRDVFHRHEITETTQDVNDQITRRLEDLGMDQTFRDVDQELSKLMNVDKTELNSGTERPVVQPLSSINLNLLDLSRTREWRNSSLEYAKQWLDSTAPCSALPIDVENCVHCDEDHSEVFPVILPQEELHSGKQPCSFDTEVIGLIPHHSTAYRGERPYSKGIGMQELGGNDNTTDVDPGNVKASKARSRFLFTETALGIPLHVRSTKPQVYSEDKRYPKIPNKQNHDSISKGRESSTIQMAPHENIQLRTGSTGSSTASKGEVRDRKSEPSEPVTEHTSRSGVTSSTDLPRMQDNAYSKLIRDYHLPEELPGCLASGEPRKACISSEPLLTVTDKAETKDKSECEKSRDSDAQSNQQQRKILGLLRADKSSETSAESPSDTKLFHEMTLEWSAADESNLLATKEPPERCYVCSRTARLPDIPSLKYYKLSHRCLRSSLQHVDSSTTAHSMFLINSRSETSLKGLENLTQFLPGRHGSVPVNGSSVPVQRRSHRAWSAVDATTAGKKRPISGGLTNVSDPCLRTATTFESGSRGPPIQDAPIIRHHSLRKDEQDLCNQSLGEPKTTREAQATLAQAESRTRIFTLRPQSPGQASLLGATRQDSAVETLAKPGSTSHNRNYGDRLSLNPLERWSESNTTRNVDGTTIRPQEYFRDLSDAELTDNTDVSLDGLMIANEAEHSPLDPYEYSDVESLFPTTDISMSDSVFAKSETGHDCSRVAQKHDRFISDYDPKETKLLGPRGAHQGFDKNQEASGNGDKKRGSFELAVTEESEIYRQSFELIAKRKPERSYSGTSSRQPDIPELHGTGFATERKLELTVPLRDSKMACDRRTPERWGDESIDDILGSEANNCLEEDPGRRKFKETVASFEDLPGPFMRPTKGRISNEGNAEAQSAVLQVQLPTVDFPPSSLLLPSGRVKYRKISQQISDLIPNYDVSTFVNNRPINRRLNQDKV